MTKLKLKIGGGIKMTEELIKRMENWKRRTEG